MRKILLTLIFFLSFFAFRAVLASPALAVNANVSGSLVNASGSINASVTVFFYKNGGTLLGSQNYTVNKNESTVASWTDTGDNPAYLVLWFSQCGNGGYLINSSATGAAGSGTYTFVDQDVHCTTTNSTINVTGTSCAGGTGNVAWKVNPYGDGVGTNAPNIDVGASKGFKVYKSLGGNADNDQSPTGVTYVPGTNTYNLDLPLIASGTWNLKVRSYAPIPNSNSYYEYAASIVCGSGITVPANLVATPTCPGGFPVLNFTWTPAYPGTFNYVLEEWDQGGINLLNSYIPSPTTRNYVSHQYGNYVPIEYSFRVKATDVVSGNIYHSLFKDAATPSCFVFSPATFVGQTDAITCASNSDNGDLTDSSADLYTQANPRKVKIQWNRATPNAEIQVEQLEFGTSAAFTPGFYAVSNFTYSGPSATTRMHIIDGSGTVTPLNLGTKYYYRINTRMSDGVWYQSPVMDFTTPAGCSHSGGTQTIVTGYSYCANGSIQTRLKWTVRSTSVSWSSTTTFNVYKTPTTGGRIFVANTPDLSWTSGSTAQTATYNWEVWPVWASGNSPTPSSTSTGNITVASCPPAVPNAPSDLSIVGECISGNPSFTFSFYDNATNESNFILDVSTDEFTGQTSSTPTNTLGYKTINYTNPYGLTTFIWSSTNPLSGGNANPQVSGNNLIPMEGTTYYWRVRAQNGAGLGNSVYNDGASGTIYPTGISHTNIPCKAWHDLSVSVIGGSWRNSSDPAVQTQSFIANETVTVDMLVTNTALSYVTAVPINSSKLYFYKQGASMPSCVATAPGSASSPLPAEVYSINALAPGDTQTITVTFNVGGASDAFTGYAYVSPTASCAFSDGGTDPNWLNNISNGFSYTVGVNKFFETKGGDVGAKGNISVGIDSGGLGSPKYQSDYLIAAGDINRDNSNVKSKAGQTLDGYSSKLVPSEGVYSYFEKKFLETSKQQPNCTVGNGPYNGSNKFYYCSGHVVVSSSPTIVGNPVFFIDGDLNINADVLVASGSTAVFIVKGDINVATSVLNIHGIYVAQRGFTDGDNGGEMTALSAVSKLTIKGALYVDALGGGKVNLVRHWGPAALALNGSFPSDIFQYEPSYIQALSTIIGSSPVGWAEKAP